MILWDVVGRKNIIWSQDVDAHKQERKNKMEKDDVEKGAVRRGKSRKQEEVKTKNIFIR